MGKFLAPDDIQKGMRVTVLENKPLQDPFNSRPSFPLPGDEWKGNDNVAQATGITDRSYMGDVLTVTAVDYPYIALKKESRYEHDRYPVTIDIRRTTLMQLSDEYVRNICPHLFST